MNVWIWRHQDGYKVCFESSETFNDSKIAQPAYIGLDIRPRSHLNSMGMYFIFLGSQVLCIRIHLREEDLVWTILAKAGIKEIIHLPFVPLTITEEDLKFTKGS